MIVECDFVKLSTDNFTICINKCESNEIRIFNRSNNLVVLRDFSSKQ